MTRYELAAAAASGMTDGLTARQARALANTLLGLMILDHGLDSAQTCVDKIRENV